jgi:hypothetical protein
MSTVLPPELEPPELLLEPPLLLLLLPHAPIPKTVPATRHIAMAVRNVRIRLLLCSMPDFWSAARKRNVGVGLQQVARQNP